MTSAAALARQVQPRPIRSRWRWIAPLALALILLVLAIAALIVWWLQPQRAVALLLRQAGPPLGLHLYAAGPNDYRLRGTPQLVMRNLTVTRPGVSTPLLQASQVLVAVPWSTIRARGQVLDMTRLELDGPRLNLAQLQAWLATGPEGGSPMPVFSDGLAVTGGRIGGAGWQVNGLAVHAPRLHPARPLQAHVQGTYTAPAMRSPFDVQIALTRPSIPAGAALTGTVTPTWKHQRIRMRVTAAGPLRGNGKLLTVAPLRASAQVDAPLGGNVLSAGLALNTHLRLEGDRLQLHRTGLAVRSQDPRIPGLDAHGTTTLDTHLSLQARGTLLQWPTAWPALPAPLGDASSALTFALQYSGAPGLTDLSTLQLRKDSTVFQARLRLPQLLAWADTFPTQTPLPPLHGQLHMPRLDISGAQLHGVEVTIDDPQIPTPRKPPPRPSAPPATPAR